MSRPPQPPTGWTVEERDGAWLYVRPGGLELLRAAGADRLDRWRERLDSASGAVAGRGAVARLEIRGGAEAVIKKMKRGGFAATLLGDRFLDSARVLANLVVPDRVRERGIPTPAALALFLRSRRPGVEAWLALEALDGRDLLSTLHDGPPPAGAVAAALGLVRRMHDAGVHHRDLNLGNLLVRSAGNGTWEVFVLDLDRAELRTGPLDDRTRSRALRRLERSYVKNFGVPGPLGEHGPGCWDGLYAGGDASLARRLEAHRHVGRLRIALHRLRYRG